MKFIFSCAILFVFSNFYSQNISGTITDNNNQKIANATLLFKEASNLNLIKEFNMSRNGTFSLSLKKEYQTLVIEVKANGYITQSIAVEKPIPSKSYVFNVVLEKDKNIVLKEVVIIAKKKPFEVVEDTVKYNVAAYSNGTERKIEEIIKKLPGIEVDSKSGQIKYKGTAVETVTLEDDNLFGSNYTLGTKNINVDMVDQVQAVDNYSENPLLKGIEQEGKVSLNLKLKKGKVNFSGDLSYGGGLFDGGKAVHQDNVTVLGITKKFKSFGTLNYNNIGVNSSPFDYVGFNLNVEDLKESNVSGKKIISESQFSNVLGTTRTNVNNQLFGNYSSIFKIGDKWSVKTNLYYLQDKIIANNYFESQYQINNQNFSTSDNTLITKKPEQYRADVELKYTMSKTSLLEYNFRIKEERIGTPTQILQNNTDQYSSFLDSRDLLYRQNLLWTKKISDKKVVQINLFHSSDNLPQQLSISPSLFDGAARNDIQESAFKKNYLEVSAKLLGAVNKNKYNFKIGALLDSNPFRSNLYNQDNGGTISAFISENNFDYTKKSIYQKGEYTFRRGKFSLSPSYSLAYQSQYVDNRIENEKIVQENFIVEPRLYALYRFSNSASLSANASYSQNSTGEQFFFTNQILINNRSSTSNRPSLNLQKSQNLGLNYNINDLFNQFELNAGLNYSFNKGSFFSNSNITQNATQVEYFFLPQGNKQFGADFMVAKYISFLESTLKLKSNFTSSTYSNIVNDSELRANSSRFFQTQFLWKTAFDLPINFENEYSWRYSNSKSQGLPQTFTNSAMQDEFRIIVKPFKRWNYVFAADYYVPDLSNRSTNFLFLDSSLEYVAKKNKWRASFKMTNIANEKNFQQIQTNDFSTTIFRSNLVPRYFLVNWSFSF
ncbi:hypothetical protein [Flavobacterium sp.]|uniref:hypothetical protein n=1 Tax=Flavobacterium sp. TaxID=239 RepID=UPI00263467F6|nr:hypothetical protein [Flavobacterium sp.]MDG2432219.1 hypothetical protein [Flavobacterium sp.]